jgi:hypothetical protein
MTTAAHLPQAFENFTRACRELSEKRDSLHQFIPRSVRAVREYVALLRAEYTVVTELKTLRGFVDQAVDEALWAGFALGLERAERTDLLAAFPKAERAAVIIEASRLLRDTKPSVD